MPYRDELPTMPPSVREFANYKAAIQGCSEKTVGEYVLDLRTFFRYLTAVRNGISPDSEEFEKTDLSTIGLDFVSSITTEDIYEFLMYTGSVRGNGSRAKARKLSAIKAYFKYLTVKRHLLETNPAVDIETPKAKNTVKSYPSERNKIRDYTIVTLFLNCGMRVSELVGINITDLDPELRSLRVVGKGSKERIIYLNEACRASLAEYLPERLGEKYKSVNEKALFLSQQCRRMSVQSVQWMVYKYLDAAGYGSRHLSVHKLRHTAATLMYQSGEVDVRVLKDILGHEQLNTTQIYTHVSDRNMQAAMEHNPLSKIKPE